MNNFHIILILDVVKIFMKKKYVPTVRFANSSNHQNFLPGPKHYNRRKIRTQHFLDELLAYDDEDEELHNSDHTKNIECDQNIVNHSDERSMRLNRNTAEDMQSDIGSFLTKFITKLENETNSDCDVQVHRNDPKSFRKSIAGAQMMTLNRSQTKRSSIVRHRTLNLSVEPFISPEWMVNGKDGDQNACVTEIIQQLHKNRRHLEQHKQIFSFILCQLEHVFYQNERMKYAQILINQGILKEIADSLREFRFDTSLQFSIVRLLVYLAEISPIYALKMHEMQFFRMIKNAMTLHSMEHGFLVTGSQLLYMMENSKQALCHPEYRAQFEENMKQEKEHKRLQMTQEKDNHLRPEPILNYQPLKRETRSVEQLPSFRHDRNKPKVSTFPSLRPVTCLANNPRPKNMVVLPSARQIQSGFATTRSKPQNKLQCGCVDANSSNCIKYSLQGDAELLDLIDKRCVEEELCLQ